MRHTDGVRDATARRLSRLHAALYRATRGRVGTRLVANDMLLLTTRGRTSGRAHTVPLLYLADCETLVVIASWGGRDVHPDWYLNLVAQPTATVMVEDSSRPVVARTAGAAERATWWKRAQAAYPGYRTYQHRTRREIPIVILEPTS
ncbi:MAG: nitroreductase family deazaflavin-dependent oxidoreductase [Acidimicrobiia bacterium]|nr:nitroreductase family deazaflavin-dependent oxidoreductase [Acidimicrobiia bacterium]